VARLVLAALVMAFGAALRLLAKRRMHQGAANAEEERASH
jgi:hypothetical protein